jgi:hypothetical protein
VYVPYAQVVEVMLSVQLLPPDNESVPGKVDVSTSVQNDIPEPPEVKSSVVLVNPSIVAV